MTGNVRVLLNDHLQIVHSDVVDSVTLQSQLVEEWVALWGQSAASILQGEKVERWLKSDLVVTTVLPIDLFN